MIELVCIDGRFLSMLYLCRDAEGLDKITRYSMGCPALPLCGLAIGEAERGLPDINTRIRALMDRLGFGPEEHFHVRMTGCPNGCVRPYMAELGFVADGPNSYQLWLGGTASQTRLAEPFMERMKVQVSNPAEICLCAFLCDWPRAHAVCLATDLDSVSLHSCLP